MSEPMGPKCRLCGCHIGECTGWLERVNEKGVPGVYECRPSCGVATFLDRDTVRAAKGEE